MKKEVLLKIARDAIKEKFTNNLFIDKESLTKKYPFLSEDGAVFVTLNKDKDLRGCIGSLIPHRTLLNDIIYNAQASAFDDVRFLPLSTEEFDDIDIEVSVLSKPQELKYSDTADLKNKIIPNVHGVILEYQNRKATFLPQVWEQLAEFELFFSHLGQKAGLGTNVLELHPKIYTYIVESFSE